LGTIHCSLAVGPVHLQRRFFSGPLKWRYRAILHYFKHSFFI